MLDKTVNSTTYKGGDNQSVFPIPFSFIETSHIEATLVDAKGVATDLRAGVDFAVNRMSDGEGEFILLGDRVLSAKSRLTISRVVPLTQEILFHNQGPNSPQAIEEGLDKLTMIAQQLAAAVARRLQAPEGRPPDEIVQALLDSLQTVEEIQAAIEALQLAVAQKPGGPHSHAWNDIAGLEQRLSEKADAASVQSALETKANTQHRHAIADVHGLDESLSAKAGVDALNEKSPVGHGHALADIRDLQPALSAKADVTALAEYSRLRHASRHAAGGEDPLAPEDIGSLPAPPKDGKTYLAANGGWVEYVASGGEGEGGGTTDHSQLLNRSAPDQHPQEAIQNLARDLGIIRDGIAALESAGAAMAAGLATKAERADLPGPASAAADGLLSAGDKSKLDKLGPNPDGLASREYVDGELTGRDVRLAALESSRITDAPSDHAAYVRQSGTWARAATGIVGEIRLLPFRSGSLPDGWYFCNGDRYALASEQGRALDALPATFKTDWGIAAADGLINLPNLFNGDDGCFLRPVNNGNRFPGSRQTDAIRNIAGTLLSQSGYSVGALSRGGSYPGAATGAFGKGEDTTYGPGQGTGAGNAVIFDASLVVPTASENRPLNIGMTPSIYLGV